MAEITIMEPGESMMMDKAKEIGDVLVKHYPGHLWCVQPMGAMFVVKNLTISGMYGFAIHDNLIYSASYLAKRAVFAGGELLERAGMSRGKWNGEHATKLEGASSRFFRG